VGLFNRLFNKKEKLLAPIDISDIRVDVHSHLIPGIDDGAKSMEETIAILKEFELLGYKKVITTPHTMSDFYKNTPKIILDGLEEVRIAIKQENIKIEIEAASEYNLDADFEQLIDADNVLTFGDKYLLFELPFFQEPPMLDAIIWKLQTKQYKPVLAHVERYSFWFNDWERIEDLKARGVFFQLNINSLVGHYGPDVKKLAEKLIDYNMVDMVGSDCHNLQHIAITKQAFCYPYLHKLLKNKELINKKL